MAFTFPALTSCCFEFCWNYPVLLKFSVCSVPSIGAICRIHPLPWFSDIFLELRAWCRQLSIYHWQNACRADFFLAFLCHCWLRYKQIDEKTSNHTKIAGNVWGYWVQKYFFQQIRVCENTEGKISFNKEKPKFESSQLSDHMGWSYSLFLRYCVLFHHFGLSKTLGCFLGLFFSHQKFGLLLRNKSSTICRHSQGDGGKLVPKYKTHSYQLSWSSILERKGAFLARVNSASKNKFTRGAWCTKCEPSACALTLFMNVHTSCVKSW